MNKPLIEACVDSYTSALNAIAGGADRLELCAHLAIGGTTPSPIVLKQILRDSPSAIKINVLIRPRFGDFLYTQDEMELMKEEIKIFADLGVNGVVIGCLQEDGNIDIPKMRQLISQANNLEITLHRAFDMSCDPYKSMEEAINLGIHTILTSGQQNNVVSGKELLKDLYLKANGRIDIMAGCGVKKENIKMLSDYTGIKVFHTTGRAEIIDSKMKYRNKNVFMGLPSLSEYEIWQTNTEEFRQCAEIVHSL